METTIKFCPRCKSTEIEPFAGGVTGSWQCKNCKFLSSLFPEKIVELVDKEKDKKQTVRRKKNGRRRKQ